MAYAVNILIVLGVLSASASFAELVSWYLVYRTPAYKSVKSQIERVAKKLDEKKGEQAKAKKHDRVVKKLEKELKRAKMVMQAQTFRSTFILAIVMIVLMSYMNSYYAGVVVAKLPFVPFSFIQSLSHRNLEGDDMTDCSMIFLYVVAGMGVRANLKKILGHEPPKATQVSIFDIPDDPNSTFK